MDSSIKVYAYNPGAWESRAKQTLAVWGWDEASISNAKEWEQFFAGLTQSEITAIGNGLFEANDESAKNAVLYWFDVFNQYAICDVIQAIWWGDASYRGLFYCPEKIAALSIEEIRPYPRWRTIYTSDKKTAYIWLAADLTIISSFAWIYCDQNENLFTSAQSIAIAEYAKNTRFDSGWSPIKQFEQIFYSAINQAKLSS